MSAASEYGVAEPLKHGLDAGRPQAAAQVHPVQMAMARADSLALERNDRWLCQVQGVHAPLRLRAELRAVRHVQRLPFLRSSHLMRDTLTGRDQQLDFGDFLGGVEASEVMGQPHAMVEKQLGLL